MLSLLVFSHICLVSWKILIIFFIWVSTVVGNSKNIPDQNDLSFHLQARENPRKNHLANVLSIDICHLFCLGGAESDSPLSHSVRMDLYRWGLISRTPPTGTVLLPMQMYWVQWVFAWFIIMWARATPSCVTPAVSFDLHWCSWQKELNDLTVAGALTLWLKPRLWHYLFRNACCACTS